MFRFGGVFAVLYLALLMPWPGWREAYGAYFTSLGRVALPARSGVRFVRVEHVPPAKRNRTLDTRIVVANLEKQDASGRAPVGMIDLDSRGIGFLPTALIISLIVATPVSRNRRLVWLLVGLIAIHALIAFVFHVAAWNGCIVCNNLDLEGHNPLPSWLVVWLDATLVDQMGAGFVLPSLLWLILCLQSGVLKDLLPLLQTSPRTETQN